MIMMADLVSEDRIRIFDRDDKTTILSEMSRLLSRANAVGDPVELERAVFEREAMLSTGIGLGIAIPHVCLASVSALCMAIGIVREGVDFKSFDDRPVTIIIMIAAPEGSHREYLGLLAKLVLILKNPAIRERILKAETPADVYEIFKAN